MTPCPIQHSEQLRARGHALRADVAKAFGLSLTDAPQATLTPGQHVTAQLPVWGQPGALVERRGRVECVAGDVVTVTITDGEFGAWGIRRKVARERVVG